MHRDDHPDRRRLLDLQAALEQLRDGLLELNMALQEHALKLNDAGPRSAKDEADRLLRRLRG